MQEMRVWSLGWEDPWRRKRRRSSILAWEIPWIQEPDGLQSMGSQRVRHDLATEQQEQRQLQREVCKRRDQAPEESTACWNRREGQTSHAELEWRGVRKVSGEMSVSGISFAALTISGPIAMTTKGNWWYSFNWVRGIIQFDSRMPYLRNLYKNHIFCVCRP